MKPNSQRIRELFVAAVAKADPMLRDAFVEEASDGDEELAREVRLLLEAHENASSFLESPAIGPMIEYGPGPIAEGPGTVIGPYKLLEQIGEGGMGVVFMAEQTVPVRRKVALKIIKPGMDTKQVIARFEAERQALAMMDHPNIAKVFDGGTTGQKTEIPNSKSAGNPKSQIRNPKTEHRNPEGRGAMAPGPDFGFGSSDLEFPSDFGFGSSNFSAGRPYFVMELVRGIPITEYCDRYRLPIEERLALFVQVCQAVQHAHQKGIIHRDLKPSNVMVTMIDGAAVPKVIDFGVAKAMGQQLTEKTLFTNFAQLVRTPLYMSPEQAEISGVDVDTRSDIYVLGVLLYELMTGTTPFDAETFRTAGYDEMRRILREQEPPRPSTRISTLEATAPTISANRQTDPRRLRKSLHGELDWIVMKCLEKDRRRRYETANSLVADLQHYLNHEPVDAGPPSAWYRLRKYARRNRAALATAAVVATALLAGTAASTWEAIRAIKAEGLAETRAGAERAARDKADQLLGEVTQERNRADVARQDADRRATEAREVVDFLINDLIGAASPSQAQGKIPTVDQVLARADENVAKKFGDRPLIEASIRHALSQAYEELGQYQKAEQHAAKAVELRMARLGAEHAETIAAQNTLGFVLIRESGRAKTRQETEAKAQRAQSLLAPVLTTARKALGPEHQETLGSMHVLAAALSILSKHEEARALDEELLAARKRVLGPEHPKTLSTMGNLAIVWQAMGNLERAKELYEQVLAVGLRDQPNHPRTLLQMNNLANLYGRLGQHDRQIDLARRTVEGRVRVLGLGHPFTQQAIGAYFNSARTGRVYWEEAQRTLGPILDRSHRELGPQAEFTIGLTGWLADTCGMLGQTEKAVALVDRLPENRQALSVREEVARYLYLFDHRDAALVQFERVEALRPRLVPADGSDSFGLWTRTRLALVLREHGRFAEARPLFEQALAESLRLRKKLPKPVDSTEQARGLAQFLLGRWPGLAPGIRPKDRPRASFAIEAPFRAKSPVADGRIEPREYGPGIEARFDRDTNPGRLYAFFKSRSKTPDDLSAVIYTAHTDQSLFVAFRVRDQFVDDSDLDAHIAHWNDSVQVYINGDHVANDLTPVFLTGQTGNPEGFQLTADAAGHRDAAPAEFAKAAWKVGTSRTADGYIVEFEIPLAMIDTRDGPEFVPAASGSELLVNFGIIDNDAPVHEESDYAIFWAEDPDVSPFTGGEDFWTVSLRLAPKPAGP
jgi:serine/threonine protein kinase/tetratricopeptide (TPR) repeat protein